MSDRMWTEKYRPNTLSLIVGNEEAKSAFIAWLKRWKIGDKAALLYGPPGTGKTTLAQVASKESGYRLIEMNASDVRTKEAIMRVAGPTAIEDSLFKTLYKGAGSMLFIDEVDGIFGREDRGGVGAVLKIIGEAKIPIVLAANDPWNPRLRYLRQTCEAIRFYEIRPPILIALLKRICRSEGVEAEEEALQVIVENSRGDVRSAINDLQSLAEGRKKLKVSDVKRLSPRDRQADVQETLRKIFFAENFEQARRALDESDIDYEMLLQTLHDNLPFKYVDSSTLASAYDKLSQADVFLGRITRTQSWSLLGYAFELMAAGIAFTGEAGRRPARYRFPPDKIMLLARTKVERELRKRLCLRVGSKCHVSSRVANNDFLPFMKMIFRNDASLASSMASWLQLEDEMVKYLKQVEVS